MSTAQRLSLSDLQVILASQYPRTQITASSTSAVGRFCVELAGECWWNHWWYVREAQKAERVGAMAQFII